MRILGIDPGPTQSAFALIDGTRILNAATIGNKEFLSIVEVCRCDLIACEGLFYQGNIAGSSLWQTAYMIGMIFDRTEPIRFVLLPSRTVTTAICGLARCSDKDIKIALEERYGPPGTKKNPGQLYGMDSHVRSALAVALTASENTVELKHFTVGGIERQEHIPYETLERDW
jgi:Holliday junction resolvasome RuvABC endonuclease subunit